jgi:hypothetical protein
VHVHSFKGDIRTTFLGYSKLLEFYNFCKRFRNDEISLNFYQLKWIDANMSVVLRGMMDKLKVDNNVDFVTEGAYLKSKFPILFKNGFARRIEEIEDTHNTTIKLEKFTYGTDDNKFKEYIKNDLMAHRGLETLDANMLSSVRSQLFEIYCNVEHSKSLDVYACGQYFPKRKELTFTLLDIGIGYLSPIHAKHKEIDTPSKAIDWAIEEGNTTRGDASGGGGLSDVLEYFENDLKGKFEIITGDAYWTSLDSYSTRKLKNQFCGTTIHLVFNLN